MTTARRRFYRIIAIVTTVMLIISCFSVLSGTSVHVRAVREFEIRSFSIDFADGAELTDGKNVWTPKYSDDGHLFVYRINYSLSGTGEFEAGEVEITLPSRLIKDKNGNYADELELSVPSKQELEEYEGDLSEVDSSFVYELQGDNVRIYNYHDGVNGEKLKAGATGYIEVGYRTKYRTFNYKDMAPSDDFRAEIRLTDGVGGSCIDESTDSAPCVYINTSAELTSTTKRCLNVASPYPSWQRSWGTAPEDADLYYYLVWEIRSYIGKATQPYNFAITDAVSEEDAEPVAYKLWGSYRYTSRNYQTDLREGDLVRYDYVITRHLKSTYKELPGYTITNTATAALTPVDLVDPETSISSTSKFVYRPGYSEPIGSFYHRKWGNNNWFSRFNAHWDVANYGLQELRDGRLSYLSGNIKYYIETRTFGYKWTLEDGAVSSDIDSYGKKSVTSTLTDDTFYFCDNIEHTDTYNIVIPEQERQLTAEDYSIERVDYSFAIDDALLSEQEGTFVPTNVTYIDGDVICFYGKFGGSSEWVPVGSYDLYRNEAVIDEQYVESLTRSSIVFKDNCYGYRIQISNPHYSTGLNATPYCRLKNSAYIMQQIADPAIEKVWLTNISEFTVTDSSEKTLYDSSMLARDYIIGNVCYSKLEKRVITTRSDPIRRVVTVGWGLTMSEYYISNTGKEYTPQNSGTFYDLLPVGCGIDLSTVAVSAGVGSSRFLDKSDYTVSVEDNYRNTGRTMLKVFVKEQFSLANVTFNTIYTWDSAIEYGLVLHNTTAFETGNDHITEGHSDTGGNIHDSELMKDLDPDAEGDRFVYSEHDCQLRFLVSSFAGLNKKVKTSADMMFSDETEVKQNSYYSYKLRFSTTAVSRAKNMIFFDSLENFSFTDTDSGESLSSKFKGELSSVDVSQARDELGIAPVVYYSEIENLDLELHNDLDEIYSGHKVWKTEQEIGDVRLAKAVAVDLSRAADGSDFVLDYNSAVSAVIYMQAPDHDPSQSMDPAAYNNVFMKNTVIDLLGDENSYFIHQEYTTVRFRIMSDVDILKVASTDHITPVKNITFTLSGTSFYGTEVNESVHSDKYGHITFNNIEKGEYTLSETKGSDDYLQIIGDSVVIIDDYGRVTINGQQLDSGEYYKIEDDPRIHADIELFKKNIADKTRYIGEVRFVLSGQSDYGNDIYEEAVSNENGKLLFSNIEKGTYELREASTDSGFILGKVVYTVKIDVNGNYSISSPDPVFQADTELNGTISVYNEPYHSFVLQKEGTIKTDGDAMPVHGAKYRLWGNSDYGRAVDITKTTQANGRLIFEELESGIYQLQETYAPEGYELDPKVYLVEITPTDEITITDGDRIVSPNNMGYYVFTDAEKGTVIITKKWVDTDESRQRRLADELEPVINISTEYKRSDAYFKDNSVLSDAAGRNAVRSFQHYTGEDEHVNELIQNGTAVRVDDETTPYSIYAWYINDLQAEDNGTVYWWSDAKNVYLTDNSHLMWSKKTSLKTISTADINTSKVTDMSYMFEGCTSLKNVDVSTFDTSKVVSFEGMFSTCTALEELSVSNFNTSRARTLGGMFNDCYVLKKMDLSSFDTRRVTDLSYLFNGCFQITEIDVSSFDTSKVTTFEGTFASCRVIPEINIANFTTESAKSFCGMFWDCEKIKTVEISQFDTKNVTDMSVMFYYNQSLETVDLSSFSTGNVTDMKYMFYDDRKLESINVSGFDTSSVLTCNSMFMNCKKLTTLDVSNFDLSSATDTSYMFYGCSSVETLDVGKLDLSNAENMICMFTGCSSAELLNTDKLKPSKATSMLQLFQDCESATEIDVSNFDTTTVQNMASMFSGCSGISELDVSSFDTQNVTDMNNMFNGCSGLTKLDVGSFVTKKVTNMKNMFSGCSGLTGLDLGNFNTTRVTNMASMFSGCSGLSELNVSRFDTSAVTDMSSMFASCSGIGSLSLTHFVTSSVKTMAEMFSGCSVLETLNISGFDMNPVKTAEKMFADCEKLSDLTLNVVNTSGVENWSDMFCNCKALTELDLRCFDTSSATQMKEMFMGCSGLTTIDLSSFDTSSVTSITGMFTGCSELETVYASEKWNTTGFGQYTYIFLGCTSIVGGNDTPFVNGSIIYARIDDPPDNPGYFTYKAAPSNTGSGSGTVTRLMTGGMRTTSSSVSVSYSSTDQNCSINKISDDLWEYTFTGLDPNLQFYAWEDELAGYTSDNMGEINQVEVVDGRATIVNVSDEVPPPDIITGELTIAKLVEKEDGSALSDEELAKRFTFKVLLYDEEHQLITDTALYGLVPYGRNGAVITLAHGESVTMTGIPSGYYYKVTETDETGFEQTVSAGLAEGRIIEGEPSSVTFKNTIKTEKFVSFTLAKLIDGRYELADDDYSFTISFRGLRSGVTYRITGDRQAAFTADERGYAASVITLKQGESVTVNDIPVGSNYQVTEAGGEYTAKYTIVDSNDRGRIKQTMGSTMNRSNVSLSTQTETADEGEDIAITFTNTKDVRQDLTLKKSVPDIVNDDQFEFEVTFLDLPERETIEIEQENAGTGEVIKYRETADERGRLEKLTLYLGAEDSVVFRQLPVGTLYQITEKRSAYRASYTLTNHGTGGTILSPSAENLLSDQPLTTGLRNEQGIYAREGMEKVNEGEDILVTFTNIKQQHDISVTKTVDMTYGDVPYQVYSDQDFTFLIKLKEVEPGKTFKAEYTALNTTGVIRTEYVTIGDDGTQMYKIKLKHGQTYKLFDLPENTVYSVTETASENYRSEYAITANDNAVIASTSGQNEKPNESLATAAEKVDETDLDVRITFINRYKESNYVLPNAGTEDHRPLYAVTIAGAVLFGAALLYVKRRRKAAVRQEKQF